MDSIAWSNQISGRLVLNQPVNDFNASQDIVLDGLSLSSISEDISSSGTIYNLILTPDSFTPNTLSITLAANSITDAQGVTNAEVTESIDFRPHRVRESDLLVWWELNSSNLTGGSDPSSIAGCRYGLMPMIHRHLLMTHPMLSASGRIEVVTQEMPRTNWATCLQFDWRSGRYARP